MRNGEEGRADGRGGGGGIRHGLGGGRRGGGEELRRFAVVDRGLVAVPSHLAAPIFVAVISFFFFLAPDQSFLASVFFWHWQPSGIGPVQVVIALS